MRVEELDGGVGGREIFCTTGTFAVPGRVAISADWIDVVAGEVLEKGLGGAGNFAKTVMLKEALNLYRENEGLV